MDLISRRDAVSRISDLLINELKGQRIPTWNEVYNAIGDIPSVPAVPLDKLCEWLARNAFAFECEDCEDYCKALLDCEHEVGSDQEYWKNKLTKWMEEQDAQADQSGK